jgi:hypothetical protein
MNRNDEQKEKRRHQYVYGDSIEEIYTNLQNARDAVLNAIAGGKDLLEITELRNIRNKLDRILEIYRDGRNNKIED